jgi:hypothetical protein
VRNKFGDPSFDDATLTQFANETNKDICNTVAWPFMEKASGSLTLTSGTNTIAAISDLQQLINIEVTAPTNRILFLDYMPYPEFVQRYPAPATLTAGQPSIWSVFAGALVFGPANADQNYTVVEQYIKVPTTTSSDSSTLDVPDDFSELVVLGMYARALEAADQPDYATAQYNRYDKIMAQMKIRYGIRQSGVPLVIQTRRSLLRNNLGR